MSRALQYAEGDSWGVRRTKQIVREISAWRATRGLTTEVLAERCTEWLGETENPVTTAWLNSLFAGKRKGLSLAEIEMFAAVLRVNLLELVYPTGERVEVKPELMRESADVIVRASISQGDVKDQRVLDALLIDRGGWACLQFAWELPEAISDREIWGLTSRIEGHLRARAAYELRYKESPPATPPQLARFFAFVTRLDFSPDDTPASLGEKIGDLRAYLDNNGGESSGEHQAKA